MYIQECFQIKDGDNENTNNYDENEDDEEKELDNMQKECIMRVSLLNLKKHHSLFLNLSFNACKEIVTNMPLIVLEDSQLLYKEDELLTSAYIIILGKIVMHSKKLGMWLSFQNSHLGAIGLLKIGDVIGEE